jgi:hypothetical protein
MKIKSYVVRIVALPLFLVIATFAVAKPIAAAGKCNDVLLNNTFVEATTVSETVLSNGMVVANHAICTSPSMRINWENRLPGRFEPADACREFTYNLREPAIVLKSEVFSEESLTPPKPCTLNTAMLSKVCIYSHEGDALIGWTFPEDLDLKNLVPVNTRAALKALKKRVPKCFDPKEDHSSD